MLACSKVLEAMRELDSMFEVSSRSQLLACPPHLLSTYWLSLSTRSAKLSAPSIVGIPASSVDHLDMDGSDIFTILLWRVREVHHRKSRAKVKACGAASKWPPPKRRSFLAQTVALSVTPYFGFLPLHICSCQHHLGL